MPNLVHKNRSIDLPAWPSLTGQAGSLITLLDAVLGNGGPTAAVTSLTESGTTITALIPANTTLESGDYLTMAGASPAGANGTVRITFIDSTHFSYQGPGGLGTITGSITYKRTGLGWTKPLGTGNFAAYLPQAGTGFPQHYLRLEENGLTTGGQREVVATGYETMSDINTGTNPFPNNAQQVISGTASRGGMCWRKSVTLDATARPWTIIGDGATFYLVVNSEGTLTAGRAICGFGGYVSFKPGDLYNSFVSGVSQFNSSTANAGMNYIGSLASTFTSVLSSSGTYGPRSVSQVGGSIGLAHYSRGCASTGAIGSAGQGWVAWPNPVDGSLWVDGTMFFEATNIPRGRTRGIYGPCHTTIPLTNEYDTVTDIAYLPGVTLLVVLISHSSTQGTVYFDKLGPW